MRRQLAYLFLGASLLLGVGVTITSSLSKMDTDVSYGSGKDLYFRISEKDSTYHGVDPEHYIGATAATQNYTAVDEVAKEIEDRLEFWDINANVTKEGYDTVKVSVRTQGSDEVEYSYLQTYLAYSGQHITVEAGSKDEDIYSDAPNSVDFADNGLFEEGTNAEITYIDTIPVVTIPVKEAFQGENGPLNELIKYCSDHTQDAETDEEGNETQAAKNCLLVLWAHKQETDEYKNAVDTSATDYNENTAKRLLIGEAAANAWYVDRADEDNNFKKLQLIPSSAAIKDGSYDASKADAAYKAAKFYRDVLNAKEYNYDVSFAYSTVITAGVDPLTAAGDWHLFINFGPSAIATLVALAIGMAIIAIFYRLGALAILANTAVAVEGSVLLFGYFGAQFGIGALVGFGLGAMVTAFGSMYYFHKVKQQLYEGRTLKKAHAEGTKKALWPTIDLSVVSIIVGVFLYAFVHSSIGNFGLSLVLTSSIGLLLNFILLRMQGWLLANSPKSEKNIKAIYGVDTAKCPNALKDEKQVYFGRFANKDFSKLKKPFMIGALALLVVAIAGVSVMSGLGQVYNYSGAYDDTTTLSVEYWVDSNSSATKLLDKEAKMMSDFLPLIKHEGKSLSEYTSEELITLETREVYLDDDETKYTVYCFQVPLTVYFNPEVEQKALVVEGTNYSTLAEAVNEAATIMSAESIVARANNVRHQAGSPSLGSVYLGLGLGFLFAAIYMMVRFGLARGFATGLVSMGGSVITVGFFALTRLAVTPLASIGAVVASLAATYIALLLLNRSKEIVKDSRERDKTALEFKNQCLYKASGEEAEEVIIFASLLGAFCLSLLALGPRQYSIIFLGAIFGLVVVTLAVLFIFVPVCQTLSIWLKKAGDSVSNSYKKAQEERKAAQKANQRRTNEPEEAIFIGIND